MTYEEALSAYDEIISTLTTAIQKISSVNAEQWACDDSRPAFMTNKWDKLHNREEHIYHLSKKIRGAVRAMRHTSPT